MDFFGKKAAAENEILKEQIEFLKKKLNDLGYEEYEEVKAAAKEIIDQAENKRKNIEIESLAHKEAIENEISEIKKTSAKTIETLNDEIADNNSILSSQKEEIVQLSTQIDKLQKQSKTASNKLAKSRELYKAVEYAIRNYHITDFPDELYLLPQHDLEELDELSPSVILKLHAMDVKSLKKEFRDNDKQIESLLTLYANRYTTKANQTIYKLMVIALRAELQNILYDLKYEKLDAAIEKVKLMTAKYLKIASEGNQSIAGTLTKFIGELEYLFINAVKIEYNYYVKRGMVVL